MVLYSHSPIRLHAWCFGIRIHLTLILLFEWIQAYFKHSIYTKLDLQLMYTFEIFIKFLHYNMFRPLFWPSSGSIYTVTLIFPGHWPMFTFRGRSYVFAV
jgi:hypothetical protein